MLGLREQAPESASLGRNQSFRGYLLGVFGKVPYPLCASLFSHVKMGVILTLWSSLQDRDRVCEHREQGLAYRYPSDINCCYHCCLYGYRETIGEDH